MSPATYQGTKALMIFGGGLAVALLFLWACQREKKVTEPEIVTQRKNAAIVLEAFRSAWNDNFTMDQLDQLNIDVQEKYGMRIYYKQSDGQYYVADLKGKDILRG